MRAQGPSSACVLREAGSAFIAAFAIYVSVWALSARFEQGATLSGLNQDGGGPGFLLLVLAGVAGLVGSSRWSKSLRGVIAILPAILFAAVVGFAVSSMFAFAPPSDGIAYEPIVSGVVAAAFIPRLVASVLRQSWAEPDQSRTTTMTDPGVSRVAD